MTAAIIWPGQETQDSLFPSDFTLAGGAPDLEEPRIRQLSGASDEDLSLDSPNWIATRLAALKTRDFKRINNPRRLRN